MIKQGKALIRFYSVILSKMILFFVIRKRSKSRELLAFEQLQ